MSRGFTLIEMMVVVVIISVVLVSGVTVFYRNFYSNSRVALEVSLSGQTKAVLNALERLIIYARINNIDGFDRNDCIASRSATWGGASLSVSDVFGTTNISLINVGGFNRVASNAAYISPETLDVTRLNFVWDCSGVFDVVNVTIDSRVKFGNLWSKEGEYSASFLMRNSGGYVN